VQRAGPADQNGPAVPPWHGTTTARATSTTLIALLPFDDNHDFREAPGARLSNGAMSAASVGLCGLVLDEEMPSFPRTALSYDHLGGFSCGVTSIARVGILSRGGGHNKDELA